MRLSLRLVNGNQFVGLSGALKYLCKMWNFPSEVAWRFVFFCFISTEQTVRISYAPLHITHMRTRISGFHEAPAKTEGQREPVGADGGEVTLQAAYLFLCYFT